MDFYVPLRDKKNQAFYRIFVFLWLGVAALNLISIVHKAFNGDFIDSAVVYAAGIICSLVYIVICPLLIMSLNSGLHIKNDEIYYRRILKKHYTKNDFAGLIVLKMQVPSKTGRTHVKTKDGDYEYSIVYLCKLSHKFTNHRDDDLTFNGDLDFMSVYKDYVLFHTAYDERAIEYFKSKNVPILNSKQM